ncbi:MAG: hypothetical protein RRY02_03080 [Muribaculaceae bacterium]
MIFVKRYIAIYNNPLSYKYFLKLPHAQLLIISHLLLEFATSLSSSSEYVTYMANPPRSSTRNFRWLCFKVKLLQYWIFGRGLVGEGG